MKNKCMESIIIPTMLQLRVVNRGMRTMSDPSLGNQLSILRLFRSIGSVFTVVSCFAETPEISSPSCPSQHHQKFCRRSTPPPFQSRHLVVAMNRQRRSLTSHPRRTGESIPRSAVPATPASPRKSAVRGLCRATLALDGGSPVPTPVDTPGVDHQPHQL
jgi:hypothetical protein